MKIDNIDIQQTIDRAKSALAEDKNISSSIKTIVNLLITIIFLLANRLNLNSSNSSKPPSTNANGLKKKRKKKTDKKPGGQKGHIGTTLEQVKDPD